MKPKAKTIFLFDMQGTLYPNLKKIEELENEFKKNFTVDLKLIPKSNDVIDFIKNDLNNIDIGIVTGGTLKWTLYILNHLQIKDCFNKDLIKCWGDSNSDTKKNIKSWQKLKKEIKETYGTDKIFMVGDNEEKDYKNPKAVGINTFFIKEGKSLNSLIPIIKKHLDDK